MAELIGPFGGHDGKVWDDETKFTGVRSIKLTFKDAIGSFCIVYDLNGYPVPEIKHLIGDSSYYPGDASFNFQAGERMTRLCGHIGTVPPGSATPVIRSIIVTTNKKTYGPFGVEEGAHFDAQIPDGAYISGFVGRLGDTYLNAIGFHQIKHDGVQGINVISNGGVVNIANVTYNLKGAVPGKFHSSGGSSLTATVGNVTFTSTSTIA